MYVVLGCHSAEYIWIAVFRDVIAVWSGRWLPVFRGHLLSRSLQVTKWMIVYSTCKMATGGFS